MSGQSEIVIQRVKPSPGQEWLRVTRDGKQLLSATRAAAEMRLERHALMDAAKGGRVRSYVVQNRRFFDLDELREDVPRCKYVDSEDGERCAAAALGTSGGCEAHGHTLLGPGAKGTPRPQEVRDRISRAKMGHHVSLETRKAVAEAHRKYPAERRFCVACGEQIRPKLQGLEDAPAELVAAYGLDLVPGSVIARGGGRFCRDCRGSIALLWLWEHERDRFVGEGRARTGAGPTEFSCAICRRAVKRWPSQIEAASESGSRFLCKQCHPVYRRHRQAAAVAVDGARSRYPLSDESKAALGRVWAIGERFETQVFVRWPSGSGRRPPVASDLVILTLYRAGFTDQGICDLLNWALTHDHDEKRKRIPGVRGVVSGPKYVGLRRERTKIRRAK